MVPLILCDYIAGNHVIFRLTFYTTIDRNPEKSSVKQKLVLLATLINFKPPLWPDIP